ncbi:unnamed protein product [Heligmosomoides polygyrus]|uniref:NAD(P)-binding protein n=1 Tax=Heligmosomoides polygyrus TaxID=6339 RepID=A0A183G7G2_HELPZ|nr:unnamed protein product [Heligmosomoides polygyrus]
MPRFQDKVVIVTGKNITCITCRPVDHRLARAGASSVSIRPCRGTRRASYRSFRAFTKKSDQRVAGVCEAHYVAGPPNFRQLGPRDSVSDLRTSAKLGTPEAFSHLRVPEDRILTIVGDLTDEGIQKRLINDTVGRWGHLDVLVNNAGANMNGGKVGFEADDDAYVKTMQVNLRSVIQLVRLARPHLVSSKGEIVNISSIAGLKFAVSLFFSFTIVLLIVGSN